MSFCPFALREISVLTELTLGHLRYLLADVPPQPNSPPGNVLRADQQSQFLIQRNRTVKILLRNNGVSKKDQE